MNGTSLVVSSEYNRNIFLTEVWDASNDTILMRADSAEARLEANTGTRNRIQRCQCTLACVALIQRPT